MTLDEIRTAVEKPPVEYDERANALNLIGITRVYRTGLVDLASCRDWSPATAREWTDAVLARTRPIFAALDLLKSVQRGGGWWFSANGVFWPGQFSLQSPPQKTVRIDTLSEGWREAFENGTQSWVVHTWEQAPGINGWHGKWILAPDAELESSANRLYHAFGADKLVRMYAPMKETHNA